MERFFCHKFRIYNRYIIATRCRRPKIFFKLQNLLRHRFTPTVCKDIGIRKFSFVAPSQAQVLLSPHKNILSNIGLLKDK